MLTPLTEKFLQWLIRIRISGVHKIRFLVGMLGSTNRTGKEYRPFSNLDCSSLKFVHIFANVEELLAVRPDAQDAIVAAIQRRSYWRLHRIATQLINEIITIPITIAIQTNAHL